MAGEACGGRQEESGRRRSLPALRRTAMTHFSTMIDGDDRNAVVLPPLTPALLLNKAALLNAREGILQPCGLLQG